LFYRTLGGIEVGSFSLEIDATDIPQPTEFGGLNFFDFELIGVKVEVEGAKIAKVWAWVNAEGESEMFFPFITPPIPPLVPGEKIDSVLGTVESRFATMGTLEIKRLPESAPIPTGMMFGFKLDKPQQLPLPKEIPFTLDPDTLKSFEVFEVNFRVTKDTPPGTYTFEVEAISDIGATDDFISKAFIDVVVPSNTPTGNKIVVGTGKPVGDIKKVTVEFTTVTKAGHTSIDIDEGLIDELIMIGGFPSNFKIEGSSAFDIETDAVVTGPIIIRVEYDDSRFSGPTQEGKLKLFHVEFDFVNKFNLDDVTTGVNTKTNVLTGQVSGLSIFLVEFPERVVGGEILPIDTTALLLAGAQSTTWLLPIVLSVLGIGLFVVSRKSKNS